MSSTYQLAEHVVCRQTTGDLRMLFDRHKGVMFEMNETASAVIDRLSQRPATFHELVDALSAEFEGTDADIRHDTQRLLADFASAGLVIAHE